MKSNGVADAISQSILHQLMHDHKFWSSMFKSESIVEQQHFIDGHTLAHFE